MITPAASGRASLLPGYDVLGATKKKKPLKPLYGASALPQTRQTWCRECIYLVDWFPRIQETQKLLREHAVAFLTMYASLALTFMLTLWEVHLVHVIIV